MIFVPYDNIYKIPYFTNGVVDFNYRCLFSNGVLFYGDVSKFARLYHGIVIYANLGDGDS
jgi:hypothetical protein